MDSILEHIDNWLTEQHNYRVIKRALHGMTLNYIGKLYGVRRENGEDNRRYERRILKVAKAKAPDLSKIDKEALRHDLGR